MAKQTGPGKTQDLPRTNNGRTRVRSRGLLYNFDIEGEALKPAHQLWLDQNIVPLIPNLFVTFGLRGLASRSGNASYNEQLSVKRAASVRNYLLSKGASAGRFNSSAAGEDDAAAAGQADGTEDEKFRGVVVTAAIGARIGKVEFQQVLFGAKENGFDTTATPRFLLIPHENPEREVRISNAAGLNISTRDAGIAVPLSFLRRTPLSEITSDDEVIRIQGKLPGKTFIDLSDDNGNVAATLEVSVARKLVVKAAFHFVRHSTVGTTRRVGQEQTWIREINEIYLPQANIEFQSIVARELPLTANFGKEVNEGKALPGGGKLEWDEIVDNRTAGARFNIFFVKELEVGESDDPDDNCDALATIGGVDCIFEDDAGTDIGETIAHEAGHSLGCRHNSPVTSSIAMLMWDTTDERGRLLPKVHVELMRNKV